MSTSFTTHFNTTRLALLQGLGLYGFSKGIKPTNSAPDSVDPPLVQPPASHFLWQFQPRLDLPTWEKAPLYIKSNEFKGGKKTSSSCCFLFNFPRRLGLPSKDHGKYVHKALQINWMHLPQPSYVSMFHGPRTGAYLWRLFTPENNHVNKEKHPIL